MAEQNLDFSERFHSKTLAGFGQVAGVHELVIGKITRFTYTPARTESNTLTRQRTLRIPIGEYVDEEGKTRIKYTEETVSGNVYTLYDRIVCHNYRVISDSGRKNRRNRVDEKF